MNGLETHTFRAAVLVCDAYPAEAARVKRLLSPLYDLVVSKGPLDALGSVLSGGFEAMVLGLHHHDRSYLKMIPVLKKIRPRLPIIVVADGRSLEEQRFVQREGIFYFLPRPIGSEELLAAVASAVEKGVVRNGSPGAALSMMESTCKRSLGKNTHIDTFGRHGSETLTGARMSPEENEHETRLLPDVAGSRTGRRGGHRRR